MCFSRINDRICVETITLAPHQWLLQDDQLFIHAELDFPHFPFSPIPTCFLTGSDTVIVGTGGHHVSDPLR